MLKVDLKLSKGERNVEFSEIHKKVILNGANLLIDVLNNPNFEVEVKNYTWKKSRGPLQERYNHTTDSRELVFKKIASGDDKFSSDDINNDRQIGDNDIDIHILPYKTNVNIVGKTYPNNPKTWINLNNLDAKIRKYELDVVSAFVAQNMIHEYCHNLGYGHKGNNPRKFNNKHSVPYAIGEIVGGFLIPQGFIMPENEIIYSISENNR